MEHVVGSAIVGDVVTKVTNKVCSFIIGRHEEQAVTADCVDRLETAVFRIDAAVERSDRWLITEQALLRWRSKLKRAAKEGYDSLHAYKQRILENKTEDDDNTSHSFSKSIAQVAKHFFSLGSETDMLSSSVRRLERLADCSGEFVRLVESGGHPQRFMFLLPINNYLLSGKTISWFLRTRSGVAHIFVSPWLDDPERGPEASLWFEHEDKRIWENNLYLRMAFRLSDSIDVVGIVMKCLEVPPPQFMRARTGVRKLLGKLTVENMALLDETMDANLVMKLRNNFPYFRPDPLCCKAVQYFHPDPHFGANVPPLRLWCHFAPDMPPVTGMEMVEACSRYVCPIFHHSGELLPKIIARVYPEVQLIDFRLRWNLIHGAAFINILKTSRARQTVDARSKARRTSNRARPTKVYNLRTRS